MDIFKNNRAIEDLLKQTEYLVAKRVLKLDATNNTNIFGNLNSELGDDLLKGLVSNIVRINIKQLLRNCKENNPACRGILQIPNSSIFSTIDYSNIGQWDSLIPVVSDELVNRLAEITYETVKSYKNEIIPEMKAYLINVSNLMDKLNNVDYSNVIKYIPIDWNYFYDVADEQNYLIRLPYEFNPELNTVVNSEVFPATVDEVKQLMKIEQSASLKNSFIEYLEELDLIFGIDNIAQDYLNSIKSDYLSTMAAMTRSTTVVSLPKLVVFYVVTRNILENENLTQTEKILIGGIVNKLYDNIMYYMKRLKKYISEENPVIAAYAKENNYNITVGYIKPNFDRISDEINLNTLAGAVITHIANQNVKTAPITALYIGKENLIDNKITYNDTYDTYMKFLAAEDATRNLSGLVNIYVLAATKLNPIIIKQYSTYNDINSLLEDISSYLYQQSITDLANAKATTEDLFVNFFTNNTLFGVFVNELENSENMLGGDVSPDKAAFYATIVLLGKLLIKQIKAV